MAKGIRVNQLAKELGVESKAILAKFREEGLGDKVPNHMSILNIGLAETVREWAQMGALGPMTGRVVSNVEQARMSGQRPDPEQQRELERQREREQSERFLNMQSRGDTRGKPVFYDPVSELRQKVAQLESRVQQPQSPIRVILEKPPEPKMKWYTISFGRVVSFFTTTKGFLEAIGALSMVIVLLYALYKGWTKIPSLFKF